MRSASESTSSSSSDTSSTPRPSSRSSMRRRWTNSIAPTSRPRVGCAAMSTRRIAIDLAGEDHLLLVAARERAGVCLRPAAANVELLDEPPRALDQLLRDRAIRIGRSAACRSRAVRCSRRSRSRAGARGAGGPRGCGRRPCRSALRVLRVTSIPAMSTRAASSLRKPGDRVDQLGLSVAVDAGDADDLAAAHLERNASHLRDTAVVADVQILDVEQRLPVLAGVFSTRSSTSRPTISRARLSSVAPAAGRVSTSFPRRRTVIRSAISSTSLSLWRDEDDREPSCVSVPRIANSSSASCGVSTAVGSSRMRMSARRNSALRISTRCCWPTVMSCDRGHPARWRIRMSARAR